MARRQKDAVSFGLKTRVDGKQRWFTIGCHGQPWTPIAFAEVAARFLVSHGPELKPKSLEEYQRQIWLHLLPAFGQFPMIDINRAMISSAHAKWKDSPRSANHV